MGQRASTQVGGIKRVLMSRPVQWGENVSCTPATKSDALHYLYEIKSPLLSCRNRNFGPKIVPILQVGHGGLVNIDSGLQANIATVNDYKKTCSPQTWEAMMMYANSLKRKGVKVAFFSSAPHGDEVALMRHSLVRLALLLGIDLEW